MTRNLSSSQDVLQRVNQRQLCSKWGRNDLVLWKLFWAPKQRLATASNFSFANFCFPSQAYQIRAFNPNLFRSKNNGLWQIGLSINVTPKTFRCSIVSFSVHFSRHVCCLQLRFKWDMIVFLALFTLHKCSHLTSRKHLAAESFAIVFSLPWPAHLWKFDCLFLISFLLFLDKEISLFACRMRIKWSKIFE